MTVVTVVLITGSLSTRAIVDAQAGHLWQWNVIRLGVVPFVIFFIAIIAETNRPPFDLVEADSELVGRLRHRVLVDPLRPVLPGRVHEHHHHVGHHGDPLLRWPGRPDPHIPRTVLAVAHPVVPGQDHRLPLRVRLAAGGTAPPPLRPADGPRVEAADPAVVGLAAHRGRLRGRRMVGARPGRRGGGGRRGDHPGLLHRSRTGTRGAAIVPRWGSGCGPDRPNPTAPSPSTEGADS